MSGQWEVVGKNKKNKANGQTNKLSKSEKKKFAENAPKAEDILPAMEVKTLFNALVKPIDKAKEAAKQSPSAKQAKETENVRKANKKPAQTQAPPVEKKKGPRGMEECLKALDVGELSSLVEGGKAQFGQDPTVWLRSLAATLNTKLPANPWTEHPTLTRTLLGFCPSKLSKFLLATARDIGAARQAFFENCLSAIANDLSKSGPINGWLLLAEVLSTVAPELAVSNTARWNSLMKSYQNRPNIGGALLWVLGQAGLRNLPSGIQVWENVFVPAAELRSYTRLVVESLSLMLTAASKRGESRDNRVALDSYEATLDNITSLISYGAVSKEVAALYTTYQDVSALSIDQSTMFKTQLSRINKIPTSHPIRAQMLQSLVQNYQANISVVSSVWTEIYRSNLTSSANLLRYIHSQWSNYKSKLSNLKFKEFLIGLQTKSMEISNVKGVEKEGLMECQRLIEDLLKKLTNMSGGFPWKTANFLMILAITGLAAYDVNKHGSFKASSTGIFLENSGALHYGQKALVTSQHYYQQAYQWGEKELPPLWARYGEPTWTVVKDQSCKATTVIKAWALNVANWANETWPVVAEFIERYAPGLLGKCQETSAIAWSYTKEYSELGFSHAKNASSNAVTWLNTNVFVGQLSAENLSRVSLEAYNATQAFAIDTYQWISEKVLPTTSKSA